MIRIGDSLHVPCTRTYVPFDTVRTNIQYVRLYARPTVHTTTFLHEVHVHTYVPLCCTLTPCDVFCVLFSPRSCNQQINDRTLSPTSEHTMKQPALGRGPKNDRSSTFPVVDTQQKLAIRSVSHNKLNLTYVGNNGSTSSRPCRRSNAPPFVLNNQRCTNGRTARKISAPGFLIHS